MDKKRLVVISGNGLSQACSEEFGLAKLTGKLREELSKVDVLGPEGLQAAVRLAEYLEGPSGTRTGPAGEDKHEGPGFEQIVGAFDSLRRSIALLRELKYAQSPLADAIGPGELADIEAFCERVYRRGTAAALLAIESAAADALGEPRGVLTPIVESLLALECAHTTFATLSYDTLLMQELTQYAKDHENWHFADMVSAKQYKGPEDTSWNELWADPTSILGHKNRTRLIHLHGSVQFWRARGDDRGEHLVKISDSPKVRAQLFEAYGCATGSESQDLIAPLVIYGNQRDKSVLADEPPFSVAYEVLREDLKEACGVLVIGYSFEDAVLNKAISESLAVNSELKAALVVTQGTRPEPSSVNNVLATADRCEPVVLRDGIAGDNAIGTSEWTEFISNITGG